MLSINEFKDETIDTIMGEIATKVLCERKSQSCIQM